MENRSHALIAGIFVILLGIASAVSIWYLGGRRESTNTYLLWTTRNVSGLNVQAQVRYRGIQAGKVTGIEVDRSGGSAKIMVRIEVDSKFPLTTCSTAQFSQQILTGIASVQIEEKEHDKCPVRTELPVGGDEPPQIAIDKTIFDKLGDMAPAIMETVASVNALLNDDNRKHLNSIIDNLAAGSAGLKKAPQLMDALHTTLSPANIAKFGQTLAHIEKISGEATPLAKELRLMVKNMTALSEKIDHVVTDTGTQFTASTLPQVDALVRDLNANSRQVSRLLDTLDESPQALIFGKGEPRPGPGEPGFAAPVSKEK